MEILDTIKVNTKDSEFLGILMPNSDNKKIVLKLNSGYNIGIDKKKIKKIKVIKRAKLKKKIKIKKIKKNSKLPLISILHTGGTISSKVDYETGAVDPQFKPEEILDMIPELNEIARFNCRLISNIFSEDMNFKFYNKIAKSIEKDVKKGVRGIIVMHGTDTMHYSSAALSFMLENLPVPVVFTGAQRSIDRGSSDAYLNLICAANFIVKTNYFGVCICMHKSMSDNSCIILPGLKTKKLHTSRRDAFKVVNDTPIAEISKNGTIISGKTKFDKKKGKFKVSLLKDNLKIGILKSHPSLQPKEISNYSKFDGLILEGTGLGHFPINADKSVLNEIKKLSKKIPLVMTSQTIFGRVNMDVYSTGRELQKYVVPGEDMLSEVAFIKLAYLLSNYKKREIPDLIRTNLRGEINTRISDDFL